MTSLLQRGQIPAREDRAPEIYKGMPIFYSTAEPIQD